MTHGVEAALDALLTAMAARGVRAPERTSRVVALSGELARRLELGEEPAAQAAQVALLKDVGLLGLPDDLLDREAPLSPQQREQLCRAPVLGARLVAGLAGVDHLAPAVRAVRERWDGSGYPDGLAGEAIPVVARVVAVADAYDALLCDRPYRAALTPVQALEVVRRNAGTQFWPPAAEALRAAAGVPEAGAGAAPAAPATTAELVHAFFAERAAGGAEEGEGAAPAAEEDPPAAEPEPPAALAADPPECAEPPPERAEPVDIGPLLAALAPDPVPAAPAPPPRARAARPRGSALQRARVAAGTAGLVIGLVLALPIPDVTARCPPAHEGLVQCELQKAWLPALVIVLACITGALILFELAVVRGPATWRAWRRGDLLRRPAPPPFEQDAVLRAANWGLTYEDAHPERAIRRGRRWRREDG